MCSMRIMAHKDFGKFSLIIMIFLYFDVITINALVVSAISFALFCFQLSMLDTSSLRFFLASLHRSLRRCWGGSEDPHGRTTMRRWNKRKGYERYSRTALRGVQSQLRGRRQLYYPAFIRRRRNVIPNPSVGPTPHLCAKARGVTKWLYGSRKSCDHYERNPTAIWMDVFYDLCVKLGGGIKRLYEAAESDIKLGSGIMISRGRNAKKTSVLSSDLRRRTLNSSSDLTDGLFNPFGKVGDGHDNTYERKCSPVYKNTSPTSEEGKEKKKASHTQASAHTHQSSDLPSYEPFDTHEHQYQPYTCCGPHVFDLLCEQLKLLIEQQKRSMTMNDLGDHSASATSRVMYPVMPRPGQSGALHFDGKDISEFLDDWNLECDDYGYNDAKKCTHFPNYCEGTIKDVVKLLPGYVSRDWTALQADLKGLYWQHDRPKNTTAALLQLIHDAQAGKIDLNVYVLQYTTITDKLVSQGALSALDRVNRLLDGLSNEHRTKVLSFCAKNKWKLSAQDVGTVDPKYDELKLFVLREAQTSQMRVVYDKERAMREGQPIPEISIIPRSTLTGADAITSGGATVISSSSPSSTSPTSPISAPNDTRVDVDELTKQIARLSLTLQAIFPNWPVTSGQQGPSASDASRPPRPSAPSRSAARSTRCIWCDSTEHFRRDCAEFTAALNAGLTRYNDKGHLVNGATGEELPLMFEKGGMKKVIGQGSPVTASTRNITVDEFYGHLGGDSVLRTTLDFEEGTRMDEIVDVNVAEKRKFGREPHRRQVRPRTDAGPSQTLTPPTPPVPIPPVPIPQQSQPVYIEEVPNEEMSDIQSQPARQSKGQSGSGEAGKKYYLDSKLGQNVKTTQIGEKIMDTPVQLSMREILAVSGDVANYIHDQTRKRRISIEGRTIGSCTWRYRSCRICNICDVFGVFCQCQFGGR